jgi:hypothetical protein
MSEDGDSADWRKSRFSGNQDCLEWRIVASGVQVRNSKERDGSIVSFTRSEWAAFLAAVKAGDADI